MVTLRIKEVCKDKGIAINELADKVGMSRVSISNMIAGRQSPPLSTLEKMAAALGVEVVDLFASNKVKAVCPHCGKELHIEIK